VGPDAKVAGLEGDRIAGCDGRGQGPAVEREREGRAQRAGAVQREETPIGHAQVDGMREHRVHGTGIVAPPSPTCGESLQPGRDRAGHARRGEREPGAPVLTDDRTETTDPHR
jgi:hypothetical protein